MRHNKNQRAAYSLFSASSVTYPGAPVSSNGRPRISPDRPALQQSEANSLASQQEADTHDIPVAVDHVKRLKISFPSLSHFGLHKAKTIGGQLSF